MDTDACYFRRRAEEEFAAARAARCEYSRASHLELAERYALLTAAIEAVDEQIGSARSRR